MLKKKKWVNESKKRDPTLTGSFSFWGDPRGTDSTFHPKVHVEENHWFCLLLPFSNLHRPKLTAHFSREIVVKGSANLVFDRHNSV